MSDLPHAQAFGDSLIETGDLDPVYIGIVGARLDEDQVHRLLLAYWCFYHLGSAAWLSQHRGREYWKWMRAAAVNEDAPPVGSNGRWPRSSERRHFRGAKCVAAVDWLASRSPGDIVGPLTTMRTERDVMAEVSKWPMFGPWIAFKVADMLERCAQAPIRFSPDIILMYDEPRKALDMLDAAEPKKAYAQMLDWFAGRAAPPTQDRACGPQEVETVLCKWKSAMGGHYFVGKDITEVRHGLQGWGEVADTILGVMPEPVVNGCETVA